MKLKGWFGVALLPLAVIPAGCGDDSVCSGGIGIGIFEKTAGILKADGSLWTWKQFESLEATRQMVDADATGFANGQMCLRLRSGDVSCPLLGSAGAGLPAHAREVAVWAEGGGFRAVSACAVLIDGTMTCARVPDFGEGTFTPVRDGVRTVSIGGRHYCAITNDSRLACAPWDPPLGGLWAGGPGWIGAGGTLSGIVEVVTASGTWGGTVARDAGGDVWWLQGDETVSVDRVAGLGGPVVQLAAGPDAFCALRDDGAVLCWNDANDQLIVPNHAIASVPQRIALPKPATAIAIGPGTGAEFACALLEDTTVVCWGPGFYFDRGAYITACG